MAALLTADVTWMIGDNFEWEIVAPQLLGIKGIWIDHKGVGVPSSSETQPYKVIKTLSEVLKSIGEDEAV